MNTPTMPMLDDPENLSEQAARVWDYAREKDLAGEAVHTWNHTKEKAGHVLQSGERYVREHPGTSMLGVFSAGMLIGALIAWSAVHAQRDDDADSLHRFLTLLGRKLNLG